LLGPAIMAHSRLTASFLLSAALFGFACSESESPPHETPGSGGDTGGAGAGGEGGTAGEYVDASGRCRVTFAPHALGCEGTYDDALASANACNVACAGPAGSQLLYLRDCTPTLRCAYDGETRALVGAYLGDDVPTHCEDSTSVVAGDFPEHPTLNGYDLDLNCTPPAEASVSPTFNDHFDEPVPVGSACRSGHDDCRSAARATVCLNERGTIAGDGVCAHCRSDDDCVDEYHYAGEEVACEPSGLCSFGSSLVGACSGLGESCFTATAAYVCGGDGLCGPCETNEQCSASGPYNLCLDGVCMRSEPPP
jgi:hypothetical protein